jgi:hypothetical protein
MIKLVSSQALNQVLRCIHKSKSEWKLCLTVIYLSATNICNAKRLKTNISIFGYTQLILLFLVMSNNSKYMRLTAENYTYLVLYLFQLTRHVWNGII